MDLLWKRKADWLMRNGKLNAGGAPPTHPDQPRAKVVVLPSWFEQKTAADGRQYYLNNWRKTTQWTVPTQAEIDADRAAGAGGGGAPPAHPSAGAPTAAAPMYD